MRTGKKACLIILGLLAGLGGCGSKPGVSTPGSAASIAVSPTSAVAGSADLTLTITGSGFAGDVHNRSMAVWSVNGANTHLATTFVSATQLTAVVSAALLSSPVAAQVFVETGDPMGDLPLRVSNAAIFTVTTLQAGSLFISSISPISVVVGSPDVELTVTGSNFDGEGVIRSDVVWSANGVTTRLVTTFVSSTQLTAVVPAALLTNPVAAQVLVANRDHIEDVVVSTSNSVSFSVTPP